MKPNGLNWRKSTRCGGESACVEVAFAEDGVGMRDSKRPGDGALFLTPGQWKDLISRAKDGDLDTPPPA